ncbi:AMP-binding protein [Zhongshania sp.]|uniref:AMP-binding protein n=1 Tax=Zhongshania sp. TaxID=1971902 RepID=UPI003564140F
MNTQENGLAKLTLLEYHHLSAQAAHPAVFALGQAPLSYAALAQQLQYTHEQLQLAGIAREDRVAVILPQGPENAVLCLALMEYCCCVPLNPELNAIELHALIAPLDIALLITSPEQRPTDVVAKQNKLQCLHLIPKLTGLAGEFSLVKNSPPPKRATPSKIPHAASDTCLLLHTSGTTARPKQVPLSRQNLLVSCQNLIQSLSLSQRDTVLNMMPQFHIGALLDVLLAPLLSGGSVIIARDLSASTFFNCLKQFHATWYQGVPTMLAELCREARLMAQSDLSASLRFCRSVSAPLSEATHLQFESLFNIPVVEIYGMSEAAGLICSNPITPKSQRKGSVGRCARVAIKIIDDYGNPTEFGQVGEIIIAGKNVFTGYLNQEANQTDFIGSWFRTGDLGYFDEDGYLFLNGRIKDIINRGGEKISPLEIDNCLLSLPEIQDAACFSSEHPSLGEEVAAAVVLNSNAKYNSESILAKLSTQLSQHKIPRELFFCEKLPRNAGGKLQRHKLSEKYGSKPRLPSKAILPPRSDLERQLRKIWQHHLEIEDISVDDNFFDLGGNSLSATSFIADLEALLDAKLPPGILFDYPSIAELDRVLSERKNSAEHPMLSQKLSHAQRAAISSGIPADIFSKLLQYTSAWQGCRLRADALLFAYNTLGSQTPLFWGAQGEEEVANLARALGPDQPVYGFRSLYLIDGKNDDYSHALAQYYLKELQEIQHAGPYFLGGFCEAAKIAFSIAQQLHQQQQEPSLLCLVEKFIPQQYSGRLSLFFCQDGRRSAYQNYQCPEIGWRKYYHGALSGTRLQAKHKKIFNDAFINDFAERLKEELHCAKASHPSANSIEPPRKDLQHLPRSAYQCELRADLARRLTPNQNTSLTIKIRNASETTWQTSANSGIFLHAHWRRQDKVRIWRAASIALPCALPPDAMVNIDITVTTPSRPGRWTLELGLSDEGICHFKDHDCAPLALPTTIIYGANLWQKARNLLKDTVPHD